MGLKFNRNGNNTAADNTASNRPAGGLKFQAPAEDPQLDVYYEEDVQATDSIYGNALPENQPAYQPQRQTYAQPAQNSEVSGYAPLWGGTDIITSSFAKSSAIEFSKAALNLFKMDKNGKRSSLTSKMLFNLFSFENGHQSSFIPIYMDTNKFLAFCNFVESDELYKSIAASKALMQEKGYSFPPAMKTYYGGSFKAIYRSNGRKIGGDGTPRAAVFRIAPGMKDGSVVLTAEVFPGVRTSTGAITQQKGARAELRVQVPIAIEDLIGDLELCKTVISAHMTRLALGM